MNKTVRVLILMVLSGAAISASQGDYKTEADLNTDASPKVYIDEKELGMDLSVRLIPMIMAAAANDTATIQGLARDWADVNARMEGGSTALIVASVKGNLEAVRTLIDAGADINIQNDLGFSALMAAAARGKITVVKALVEAGAAQGLKNNRDETAYSLAVITGNNDAAKILAGGRPAQPEAGMVKIFQTPEKLPLKECLLRANEAYAASRWKEACDYYKMAYDIKPAVEIRQLIASASKKMGLEQGVAAQDNPEKKRNLYDGAILVVFDIVSIAMTAVTYMDYNNKLTAYGENSGYSSGDEIALMELKDHLDGSQGTFTVFACVTGASVLYTIADYFFIHAVFSNDAYVNVRPGCGSITVAVNKKF